MIVLKQVISSVRERRHNKLSSTCWIDQPDTPLCGKNTVHRIAQVLRSLLSSLATSSLHATAHVVTVDVEGTDAAKSKFRLGILHTVG